MHIFCALFASGSSIMLVHFAVNAWILRSKCKSEADFSNYVNNSILQGNVLTKGTVAEVQECFAMCIQHPSCQSVNYLDEALDNCELNSNIKENVLKRDFIAKQGWTYFATNYSVKNVGSHCINHKPCNADELCIDTCDCSQYYCQKQCGKGFKMDQHFKCEPENIAFSKPANFSSNYKGRSSAIYAVDGNRNTSILRCAETKKEDYAWIIVDLERKTAIRQIIVYIPPSGRRTMGVFDVRIGNSSSLGGIKNPACKTLINTKLSSVSIDCRAMAPGRFVTVNTSKKSFLEVCEIEVYGDFV